MMASAPRAARPPSSSPVSWLRLSSSSSRARFRCREVTRSVVAVRVSAAGGLRVSLPFVPTAACRAARRSSSLMNEAVTPVGAGHHRGGGGPG